MIWPGAGRGGLYAGVVCSMNQKHACWKHLRWGSVRFTAAEKMSEGYEQVKGAAPYMHGDCRHA